MAGGKGSRLKPFTDILPKPLIPIKNKTIIEFILNTFIKYSLNKFIITTNYKSEILKSYLIDKFSKNSFQFIKETKPTGTIGSLKLIKSNSSFLVSNCDVYHKIKLNRFLDFHFKNKNDISLVVAKKKSLRNVENQRRLNTATRSCCCVSLVTSGHSFQVHRKSVNCVAKCLRT